MVFEQIEKLKAEYTDKYVVVDAECAELRRFKEMTGVVRTVNMNGRALVEFDGYQNIGWYDIDLDFLKVVDKPVEKEVKPAAAKAATPAKKVAPAKKSSAKSATSAKPASGGGMSMEDILAAARGGASASPAKAAAPAAKQPAAEKPAAEKAGAQKPAAAMSVADILAAARGEGPAGVVSEAKPAAKTEPAAAKAVPPKPAPPAASKAAPAGDLPTDVPGIIEFCRKLDG